MVQTDYSTESGSELPFVINSEPFIRIAKSFVMKRLIKPTRDGSRMSNFSSVFRASEKKRVPKETRWLLLLVLSNTCVNL